MSIITYSTCRIQFIPNDQQRPKRDYSERSLIKLILYDGFADYSFQAIDIENNKQEIFNIPFKNKDQYQFGRSANQPDEIRSTNGNYHLWLSGDSRDQFHKTVRTCTELLPDNAEPRNTSDDESEQKKYVPRRTESIKEKQKVIHHEPDAPEPTIASPKDLLLDVHRLGKYIEQGDKHEAARLASDLALKDIRLKAKSGNRTENEKEFIIHVQIDGNEYGIDQHGARFPIDVFQSTTVRELRAVFELAYQYPPISQYFFVNGRLAPDNSTMKDLNVGPNSLFVLFLLTHPKTFRKTGQWVCSFCKTNNHQDNLRCLTCTAARKD